MTSRRCHRCPTCSSCGVLRTAGFVTEERLRCTRFGIDVDPGDGCTFGDGEGSRQARKNERVDLPGDWNRRGGW